MTFKKYLAIIPARGGSKRLPKKNVKKLFGKELIGWTIESALKSNSINNVVVSTDSEEIASVSKRFGAEIPFIRPLSLATDTSSSYSVVEHCIEYYKNEMNVTFENIILLQPTSPLRNEIHIKEAIELFESKKANAVISVSEMEHSPLWSNTLGENLEIDHFLNKELMNTRSQDLPSYYRLNGGIYIIKTEQFFKNKSFYPEKGSFAYIMDSKYSVDIDNEIDFLFAELLLSQKNNI
jgi:CMP-N-acetylneuraminic acid synthetase